MFYLYPDLLGFTALQLNPNVSTKYLNTYLYSVYTHYGYLAIFNFIKLSLSVYLFFCLLQSLYFCSWNSRDKRFRSLEICFEETQLSRQEIHFEILD